MINYSNFIKTLKSLFLIISILLILLILINKTPMKRIMVDNNDIERDDFLGVHQILFKPSFIGLDKKKQPFKVSAAKATKLNNFDEIFNLEKPVGQITSNNEIYFLSGDSGLFDKSKQILQLEGDVVFEDKNLFSFHTEEASVDFKKKVIFGNTKITGGKENSSIISQGFKIVNKGTEIFFIGRSKLILSKD